MTPEWHSWSSQPWLMVKLEAGEAQLLHHAMLAVNTSHNCAHTHTAWIYTWLCILSCFVWKITQIYFFYYILFVKCGLIFAFLIYIWKIRHQNFPTHSTFIAFPCLNLFFFSLVDVYYNIWPTPQGFTWQKITRYLLATHTKPNQTKRIMTSCISILFQISASTISRKFCIFFFL